MKQTTDSKDNDNKETKPSNAKLATVGEMFSFAKKKQTKIYIVAAFLCATVSGTTFPAIAFYFANTFEDLSASADEGAFMDSVREIAYTFLILGLLIFLSMSGQSAFMEAAANEMTFELETSWFQALLRQDMAYFDKKDVTGEATIIATNAAKFKKGMGRKLAEAVQFSISVTGCLVYAFYSSWRISLTVLCTMPFVFACSLFVVRTNSSQTARANATYAKAGSIVISCVTSIRTVLSLNAVESMVEKYKEATQEAYDGAVGELGLVGLANGAQFASFTLSGVIVTLYGSYLLYDSVREDGCDPSGTVENNETCDPKGADVLGAMMAFLIASEVAPQISVVIEAFVGARSACYLAIKAINRKVVDLTDPRIMELESDMETDEDEDKLPPYIIDSSSEEGVKLDSVKGEIEFRNVRFAYPTRKQVDVFTDFNLEIAPGTTVALVGPSGSGKSTVVQLIERFYDPIDGSVHLDGIDLKEINVKWLRQQIGLVSQEPKLFGGSIRDNIEAGLPGATQEEIETAAKLANAHDFIVSFPNKYDTQVGDMGGQLSGGQKQRICIARAIVKKPKILILDEATSALDSESEKVVQGALDQLMQLGRMTTVVIAHRLSTIMNADMIAVVSGGRIVETGKHDDLIACRGHYHDLVEAQKPKQEMDELETSVQTSEHASTPMNTSTDDEQAIIRFRNVSFTYPTRPDATIFDGLNLTVRQGETLALVGPSGSGKSTTIQLIEAFYFPTAGSVEFNGVDIRDLNIRWLRDQLGLVSQEPILFDTTIEENIRYGCPTASLEQVVEAAKQANAHNFITEFPKGYNTTVGPGSTLVSGGQKQRIAIARAILKRPSVLLLDEATSALDSESEKVVQQALDQIMFGTKQTCVVIAHRLSTIRNADRIAVIDKGRVREIGTHQELMAKPNGRYKRLQELQSLGTTTENENIKTEKNSEEDDKDKELANRKSTQPDEPNEIDKAAEEEFSKRARLLGKDDTYYFVVGGIGAVLAGIMFPFWGVVFAYMTEILFTLVESCDSETEQCEEYRNSIADDMRDDSFGVFYGYIGVIVSVVVGFVFLFWGFGCASERMNKRVRDAAFTSLMRQEVGWFDLHPPGLLTSQLAQDAALLHAFAGEPIRTLILNVTSVALGVAISLLYMWPFALLCLAIIPFMGFGAEMEMRMLRGEDEGDESVVDGSSPAGIAIEALANMRTIASLTLESDRAAEFARALRAEHPHPLRTGALKGGGAGLGQLFQMWGFSLMFFWGGWLLSNKDTYSYRDYLIALFGLFFSVYGLAVAAEGAINRDDAKRAAARIFELIDRKSLIDPLGSDGKTDI